MSSRSGDSAVPFAVALLCVAAWILISSVSTFSRYSSCNKLPSFTAFCLWQLKQSSIWDLVFLNLDIPSSVFIFSWANKSWKTSLHNFSPVISGKAISGEFTHFCEGWTINVPCQCISSCYLSNSTRVNAFSKGQQLLVPSTLQDCESKVILFPPQFYTEATPLLREMLLRVPASRNWGSMSCKHFEHSNNFHSWVTWWLESLETEV